MLSAPQKGDGEASPNHSSSREEAVHHRNPISLYSGPSLSSLTTDSSGHSKGGGHTNSNQIVLDENCDLFKSLSKEERLLMGLPIQHSSGQATEESHQHEHDK